MDIQVLNVNNRKEFREWLQINSNKSKECWVRVKVGQPTDNSVLWYLDAVEEAICFGWIDSIKKSHKEYGLIQKFSPRKPNSSWTKLNIERAKRLIRLGLMTNEGEKTLPDLNKQIIINKDILNIFKKDKEIETNFYSFPKLYQDIRIDSIQRYKNIDKELYKKALNNFKKQTKANKMYGNWNDYGRLLEK